MMRAPTRGALLLAACLLLPTQAFSWNYVGHELVARIAWDNLTPAAREKIIVIMRQHPARAHDLVNTMPADYGNEDAFAFTVAATWPDIIRIETNPWHAKDNHPAWHYINKAFVVPGTDAGKLKGTATGPTDWHPGVEPTDAVQAIEQCVDRLKDPKLPAADKAIALSWYLHLVGDLHQPLHACTLFSDRFPAGDRGGNGQVVRCPVQTTQPSIISEADATHLPNLGDPSVGYTPASRPADGATNLHAYWDNVFGRFGTPRVIDALQREITGEYPPAALAEAARQSDFTVWMDESFAAAVKDAHLDGTLKTSTLAESQHDPASVPLVPDGYLARAQEVCRLRIATAGYRAADQLNAIFGTP